MRILIGLSLFMFSLNAYAQTIDAAWLKEISTFAAEICVEVEQKGEKNKFEITGALGANASGLTKLIGISLDADGKLTKTGEDYVGVTRDSLPEQLKDVRQCKKELAKALINARKLVTSPPESQTYTNPRGNYSLKLTNGFGLVRDVSMNSQGQLGAANPTVVNSVFSNERSRFSIMIEFRHPDHGDSCLDAFMYRPLSKALFVDPSKIQALVKKLKNHFPGISDQQLSKEIDKLFAGLQLSEISINEERRSLIKATNKDKPSDVKEMILIYAQGYGTIMLMEYSSLEEKSKLVELFNSVKLSGPTLVPRNGVVKC